MSASKLIQSHVVDSMNVLVFSSNKLNFHRLLTCFDRDPFLLLQAENYDQAISCVDIHRPNVIVIDEKNIDAGGEKIMQSLNNIAAIDPPLILVFTEDLSRVGANIQSGADVIFPYPINFSGVVEVVDSSMLLKNKKWAKRLPRVDNVSYDTKVYDDQGKEYVGSTINMGQGGMFIQLREALPARCESVDFSVCVPELIGHEEIRGIGNIRWVRQQPDSNSFYGIGIEFSFIEESCFTRLKEYINQKLVKSSEA